MVSPEMFGVGSLFKMVGGMLKALGDDRGQKLIDDAEMAEQAFTEDPELAVTAMQFAAEAGLAVPGA